MILTIAFAVGGLVLLTLAADQLVLGAGRVASRLNIAPVVVGVVVIGLGTSAPELLVSGLAAGRGEAGLAVGNIVGSNLLNLSLILGVAALVASIKVKSTVPRQEAPLMFGATVVFAAGIYFGLGLGLVFGIVLAALLVIVSIVLVRLARVVGVDEFGEDVEEFLDAPRHRLSRETLRTVGGLVGTLVGAQVLVVNASSVAADIGVPPAVIGFTLVALGTSMPELVTAIQAQRRGESDLLVGNLLGSNLFNSLGGGAAIGLAAPNGHTESFNPWLLVAMVAVSALAWLLLRRGHRVTRPEAVLLLVAYGLTLPMLL